MRPRADTREPVRPTSSRSAGPFSEPPRIAPLGGFYLPFTLPDRGPVFRPEGSGRPRELDFEACFQAFEAMSGASATVFWG
jgi:hypothetical protein